MLANADQTNNLEALYDKIAVVGREAITNGWEKCDPHLNGLENDKRLGLTLLIEITGKTAERIQVLLEELQQIEPGQYYYPISDLHLTVVDLISASENYQSDPMSLEKMIKVVKKAVQGIKPFPIRFHGMIAGDAAILAKGFYEEGLLLLRRQIRETAAANGLALQERYQSISAHATLARYKTSLQNRENLLAFLQDHSLDELGIQQVSGLDLVIHDWYNRKKESVARFILPGTL